jgi:hypothetical protein
MRSGVSASAMAWRLAPLLLVVERHNVFATDELHRDAVIHEGRGPVEPLRVGGLQDGRRVSMRGRHRDELAVGRVELREARVVRERLEAASRVLPHLKPDRNGQGSRCCGGAT